MATLVDTKGNVVEEDVTPELSWQDEVDEIDQSTVEAESTEYPFIQWVYGQASEKRGGGVPYTGGFFFPADQAQEAPEGWTPGDLVHPDGTATEGFFCDKISLAVMHIRRRWVSRTQDGDQQLFPWSRYDEASAAGTATGKTNVLAYVKGLENFGPLTITMKGAASKAFCGSKREPGALTHFDTLVVGQANAMNKKRGKKARWPRRAFWMTVSYQAEANGTPKYTKLGKAEPAVYRSLPALVGAHEKMTDEELGQLFVGRPLLETMRFTYAQAEDWAKAWDDIAPGSPPTKESSDGNGESKEEMPF